jgi:hypothetical protein
MKEITMADIIMMPKNLDALVERVRAAFVRFERATTERVEATLDLAAALAEARARFPADQEFSIWIAQHELDYVGSHDRAALISMGNSLEVSREVLQETRRTSLRLIWSEEIQPRFASAAKPAAAPRSKKGRRRTPLLGEQSTTLVAEPPPPTAAGDAPVKLIEALDTLARIFDGLDLAAARRGLNIHQRKHVEALKKRVRNWLDVLDVSK